MSLAKQQARELSSARQQELGPNRLRAVARAYVRDIEPYPFSHVDLAPEAVREAYEAFQRVIEVDATIQAAEADRLKEEQSFAQSVRTAAASLVAGKMPRLPTRPTAAGGERFEVTEEAISHAHGALVEVVEAHWAEWRRTLVERVPEDMEAARRAWEEAKAAIERAHDTHRAALGLDDAVLRHNEALYAQCSKEQYRGLAGWRRYVTLGPTRINQDAYEVIDVGLASERHRELEAWLPPGDPRREELLAQEPDTSRWWIRRAAWETEHLPRECVNCGGDLSRLDAADLVWEGGRFRWKHRSARDCARARDLARVRPRAATF